MIKFATLYYEDGPPLLLRDGGFRHLVDQKRSVNGSIEIDFSLKMQKLFPHHRERAHPRGDPNFYEFSDSSTGPLSINLPLSKKSRPATVPS